MLRQILATVIFAVCVSTTCGEIILKTTSINLPAGSLVQYTVHAIGTAGENINVFSYINLTGNLHQTHGLTPGKPISTPDADAIATARLAGLISSEAIEYDTYFLFGGSSLHGLLGARLTEGDIATSTAGTLGLPQLFGQHQPSGFTSSLSTLNGTYGIVRATSGSNLAFLQVVLPGGETASLSLTVDAPGVQSEISGYIIGIPEPTTCVLAGLALVGAAARRRV